jgi:lipopolysaccharide/colanic/teichoic acid biosynthesis glycosyltransferase
MELSAQPRSVPQPRVRRTESEGKPGEREKRDEERPRAWDAVRRGFDVVAALVVLVLTAPLMLAAMALVALTAGRPLVFGHRRVGKDGRAFRCWKLRTMTVDAEKQLDEQPELLRLHRANGFKLPAARDPRIIPVGRWLRKTHLDELPQMFNVLIGDMSLVGPRPVVEDELELFGDDVEVLLSTRPGVFGEWTSLGRARPPYPERARIEVEWGRSRGPLRDLRILLRSVAVVLRGQEDG